MQETRTNGTCELVEALGPLQSPDDCEHLVFEVKTLGALSQHVVYEMMETSAVFPEHRTDRLNDG